MEQQTTASSSQQPHEDIKTRIEQSEKISVNTKIGDLLFCPEFMPSSDPIFTTMMKDKAMFTGLYRSITGEDIKLPTDPIPQHTSRASMFCAKLSERMLWTMM
jgi:hypothetical protein